MTLQPGVATLVVDESTNDKEHDTMDTMQQAADAFEAARKALGPIWGPNRVDPTPEQWNAYNETSEALHRLLVKALPTAFVGETFQTVNGPMIVAEQNNADWCDRGRSTLLTTDGQPMVNEWETDPKAESEIYYEWYSAAGRVTHGWVNATTRRITQTG